MDAKEVEKKDEQTQLEMPTDEAVFNSDPLEQEVQEDNQEAAKEQGQPSNEQVDYKALYEAEKAKADEHKRRYVASSKENRKIRTKLKQFEAERAKAATQQITDDELSKKYKINVWPRYLIIGKDGKIAYSSAGYRGNDFFRAKIEAELKK